MKNSKAASAKKSAASSKKAAKAPAKKQPAKAATKPAKAPAKANKPSPAKKQPAPAKKAATKAPAKFTPTTKADVTRHAKTATEAIGKPPAPVAEAPKAPPVSTYVHKTGEDSKYRNPDRSAVEGPVALMRGLCEKHYPKRTRVEIIKMGMEKGVTRNTAMAQFAMWKARKIKEGTLPTE